MFRDIYIEYKDRVTIYPEIPSYLIKESVILIVGYFPQSELQSNPM